MSPRDERRRFATILFTDIVSSTDLASELGDRRWTELVRRHHTIVRRELKRLDGREMDTAGDGFFAVFDGPGAAIRCACAVTEAVREVGLEIRAGLHAGEVEVSDGKAGGIAVNTAARVMSVGGPGEVLVSSALRDVVAGSSLAFEDHGVHQLKGVEGEWRLFRVSAVDGEPRPGPMPPEEASRRRLAIEPSPSGGPGRRGLVVAAAAAVVLAVLAGTAAFVALSREDGDGSGDRSAPQGPQANAVAELDPRTGQLQLIRNDVPANLNPQFANDDIVVGEGSLWLAREPQVLKIDRQDGSQETIDLPTGTFIQAIDVGLGAFWILGDVLYRVDPATGIAGEPMELPTPPDAQLFVADLDVGLDAVWIATRERRLLRFDPETGRTRTIEVGDTPERVEVGTDAVWLLDESDGTVWRVDPDRTNRPEPIRLSSGLDRIAVGEGFVWVLDTVLGTLTAIPEDGTRPRQPISVGADATDVAVGLGSAWVAVGGRVVEVNTSTLQVARTIAVGDVPIVRLAVDEEAGTLWLDIAPAG